MEVYPAPPRGVTYEEDPQRGTRATFEGVDEPPHEKEPVFKKVKDKVKKIKNNLEKKMHGENYHHHDVDDEVEDESDGYEVEDEEQDIDPEVVHGVEIEDVVLRESIGPLEVDPASPSMEPRVQRDGGEEVDVSEPLLRSLDHMTISSQHKEEQTPAPAPSSTEEKLSAMEYGKKMANMVLEKVKPRGSSEEGEKVTDKGVTVREYVVEKLRPGEEDKALSEVILEMVQRTSKEEKEKMKGETKVVGRIREAMNSLLGGVKPGASPDQHDKQPRVVMQGNVEREQKVEEENLK